MKAIVLYAKKDIVLGFLPELENKLKEKNIEFQSFLIHPTDFLTNDTYTQIDNFLPSVQFAICLGGDGTVLAAAHMLYYHSIPILPLNFGQLGFIAENTEPEFLDSLLDDILTDTIIKENRTLLDVNLYHTDKELQENWVAINEAFIGANTHHKVANFSVDINGYGVAKYKADGIIVSTATGSTGYNLSAGGPILYPSLDSFVLTSVVPHKITHRPLVLASDVKIKIEITNEFSQSLIIDGQSKITVEPYSYVTIQKSQYHITLLYSSQRNYFQSLKEKLNWMV